MGSILGTIAAPYEAEVRALALRLVEQLPGVEVVPPIRAPKRLLPIVSVATAASLDAAAVVVTAGLVAEGFAGPWTLRSVAGSGPGFVTSITFRKRGGRTVARVGSGVKPWAQGWQKQAMRARTQAVAAAIERRARARRVRPRA